MVEELDFDVEIDSAGIGDGGDEDFDEEYDDLYDDVNVGFFPQESTPAAATPALPAPLPVAAAPGKGSGELYPRDEQENRAAPARVDSALEHVTKDEASPNAAGESGAPAAPIDASAGILARPPPQQQQQSVDGNARTGVFISELHWWTTDADLEAALADFGRHKGLKFSEERASGKSKGYCQVEFYDPLAAQQCKEELNGRIFNGRPCVVQYATPQVLKQVNGKSQSQSQPSQAAQAPQHGPAGKKNSGGGGGAGGRGRGRGRGAANNGQLPLGGMGLFGDPGFVPPMRPGIFGMGFIPRGPAYAMHYPGVPPPHVNPAFFGRGGSNGNAGGWSSGGWEESERGGGGGYSRFEEENGRGGGSKETGKASRDHEEGGKDGTDLEREKQRERDYNASSGWDARDNKERSYKSRRHDEDSGDYSKRRRH